MNEKELFEMVGECLTKIDNLNTKLNILECKSAGLNFYPRIQEMEFKIKMMNELFDRQQGAINLLQHNFHHFREEFREFIKKNTEENLGKIKDFDK